MQNKSGPPTGMNWRENPKVSENRIEVGPGKQYWGRGNEVTLYIWSGILLFEGRLGCLKCSLLTLSQPLKQQQLRQISNRITEKHI